METEVARSVDIDRWKAEALRTLEFSKALTLKNRADYDWLKDLRERWIDKRAGFWSLLDPICKRTDALHTQSVADRDGCCKPYDEAARNVKQALFAYDEMTKQINTTLQSTMTETGGIVPVIPAEKGMPGRTIWTAQVTNKYAFVSAYKDGKIPADTMMPDDRALNQYAERLKDALDWPGVTVSSRKV